jgi:hypothetical protein
MPCEDRWPPSLTIVEDATLKETVMISRTIGPLTITALQDAEGPFFEPREAAFPAATEAQWAAADAFDPAARTTDGRWWLRFRSFAIRYADGPVTLVDAGIGPADAPARSWAPVPGRLPDELAAAGIAPGRCPPSC